MIARRSIALQRLRSIPDWWGRYFISAPGTYLRKSKWTIKGATSLNIVGSGEQTIVQFALGAWVSGTVGLAIQDCIRCSFTQISFAPAAGNYIDTLVQMRTRVSGSLGAPVSTMNRFYRCVFSGNIHFGAETIFQIGLTGDVDANNDFNHFMDCLFVAYGNVGIGIALNASQSFANLFDNCATYPAVPPPEIDATTVNTSANITLRLVGAGARFFDARDVGKYVVIPGAGSAGGILRAKILTADGKGSASLDTVASAGLTASIVYGTQIGINANAGNFKYNLGNISGNLYTDAFIGAASTGEACFEGTIFEDSYMLLDTAGNDIGRALRYTGCRIAGNAALLAVPFINVNMAGQLLFENCLVGDNGTGPPLTINWGPPGASGATPQGLFPQFNQFLMINCVFASSATAAVGGGVGGGNVFCNLAPQLVNCRWSSNTTNFLLGSLVADEGATTSCNWSTTTTIRKTFNTDATLTFDTQYLGTGQLVRLIIHYTGTTVITWPAAVVWSGGTAPVNGAAGHTNVMEFFYNGTTIFGTVIGNWAA